MSDIEPADDNAGFFVAGYSAGGIGCCVTHLCVPFYIQHHLKRASYF